MKISYLVMLLGLFLMGCSHVGTKIEKAPNVILIITDDQGWGDLSYHGNKNLNTPNLDGIAHEGLSVNNFYVQPVCSPTRAEILTGKYFSRLGVYDTSSGGERMDIGVPTLGDVFKSKGYTTAAFGKWHNGAQPPYHPNARGFDEFYGFCSGHWGNYYSPLIEHNGTFTSGEGFLVDDLFNHSINFIKEQANTPFFLYLPVNTPHSPMQVPEAFWSRFKNKPLISRSTNPEQEDEDFTRAALAMVENIDFNVGRLLSFLKKQELDENTIVVFMSDNGPNGWRWNGGLKGRKGDTDEGGVKSPFFIKWPKKIKAGTQLTQIMGSIDVLPTLTGLAGISLPDSIVLDGLDLHRDMLNATDHFKNRALFNHWNGKTSVRTQNYRLDHQNRLFDLRKDASQLHDISERKPALRDSLRKVKFQWEKLVRALPGTRDIRPFTIGAVHPKFSHLPAQDGVLGGNLLRSNRWPNDSYITNWKSVSDSIIWPVNVLASGDFEIFLHYTCQTSNLGTRLELSLGNQKIGRTINEAFESPLDASLRDIYPRMESDVKAFKRIKFGELTLSKGIGTVYLTANQIPGQEAIDFRMLEFVKK